MRFIHLFFLVSFFIFSNFSFSQTELKTYNDSLGFYTFTYPSNFEIKKLAPATVMIVSALDSPSDAYREDLTISLSKAPEGLTLDSLSTLLYRSLTMKYLGLSDGQQDKITINGYEGRRLSVNVMDKQLISTSLSFAIIKGLITVVLYKNEFQPKNNEIYSFNELIQSLKTNW